MKRPNTSGYISILVYFIVLSIVLFGLQSNKQSAAESNISNKEYMIDFIPSTESPKLPGVAAPKCHCYLEFVYDDDDKIYKMETDHDGAPVGCETMTGWEPMEIVHHCAPNQVCVKFKRRLDALGRLPRMGWGQARRICSYGN